MKRKSTAIWKGTGIEGKGTLTSASGVLKNTPYSFSTRFKNEEGIEGTNPEELIAAAHSGCYAMALTFILNKEGFVANELQVDAAVVEGISTEKFLELANVAKVNCPVSQALKAIPITLSAKLE